MGALRGEPGVEMGQRLSMTTSQQLTARAEERRKADHLAAAVARYLRLDDILGIEAMNVALDAYIEARR